MTPRLRPLTALALALGIAAATVPVRAADLPHGRRTVGPYRPPPRPEPVAIAFEAVVPAVPLAPVLIAPPPPSPLVFMPVLPDPILAPRRGGCQPGFMIDADGVCRRTGALLVACDPYGESPCRPLPPTPIPYGIGPYLRPDY